MVSVRRFHPQDARQVGTLIADTYSEFNLSFASPAERDRLLGPFQYAHSSNAAHQEAIAEVIQAELVLVAEEEGEIVGILRGRPDKLQSLFVRGDHHRRGIGRSLVEHFERVCVQQEARVIRVMATLYAVPFYQAMGYKRSTGVRTMHSFEGAGLPYQPMKKVLR